MDIKNNLDLFIGNCKKYGRYGLPILFLLACGSSSKIPTISLFEYRDSREVHELDPVQSVEECDRKNGTIRKSIAYPDQDIHELYPYMEEIPLETDSLKNK